MAMIPTGPVVPPGPGKDGAATGHSNSIVTAELLNAILAQSIQRVSAAIDAGADANYVFGSMYAIVLSRRAWTLSSARVAHPKPLPLTTLPLPLRPRSRYSCKEGYTPLMAALQVGNMDVVRRLLQAGADPNFLNSVGDAAMFWAIDSGAEAILLLHEVRPTCLPTVAGPLSTAFIR